MVERWPATPKRARHNALIAFSWWEDKYANKQNAKTAETSFSKLKLIKSFFRSSMSQEELSGLALLSIENEQAQNLDFRKVIQQFASAKATPKNFN